MGKIAFLGDSVTKATAYGGVTATQAFAHLIGTANGYAAADIINAGVGGDNSAQALARLDADVITHLPDVCVIMLGNNDCQGSNALTAGEMTTNIEQIIVSLRAANIKPVLFSMGFDRGDNAKFAAYVPYLHALDQLAVDARVDYIDVFREFALASLYFDTAPWGAMFVDSLHLTASGHQYIANFTARSRFAGVFVKDTEEPPATVPEEPLACALADYLLLGASAERIEQIQTLRAPAAA